jgi:uncharacterized membrane protein YoaK (UPF0700 family)
MAAPKVQQYPARWNLTILMLAIIGGSLDAVIYRAFHTMSGAQSGNTILLGVALVEGKFSLVAIRVVSFCGYVLGAAAGQIVIVRHRPSWPWPAAVGSLQVIEVILIGCLIVLWRGSGLHPATTVAYTMSATAAFVMGVQSAAILDLPGDPPTTTYITGTLTTFVTRMVKFLHLIETEPAKRPEDRENEAGLMSFRTPWIYGVTWVVYLVGAVIGLALFSYAREMALLLPFGTAMMVFALSRTLATGIKPDE